MSDEGPEWFAPKRYGYGAGPPIAWQGWLVVGAYVAVIGAAAYFLRSRSIEIVAVIVPTTTLLLVIAAKTTRGGWRWRWGKDD